jgi:fatty acid desaturase
MRELANLSAHSAIDRYARRRVKAAAWGKVLTTAVGLGAGAVLLWIWWTNQTSELTFYAALVSLLVALLWGLQCVRLAGGEMPHRSQDPVGQSGEDRNEAGADAAAQDAEARGQYALPGDEAGPPIDDSEQTWEQELESLVEAWPRPDST